MATRTTDFPTALKDTLFDVFDVSIKENMNQYSKVFDMNTSSDNYEDILQFQGPDEIASVAEGGPFERVEVENVRSKRYSWLIYKGERKITREALDDLKYNQIIDAVKQLARASNRTIERLAASFFYGGLSGAELTPDGVAVFHDSHPLANPIAGNPSYNSNKGTGKLSSVNIKQARILGRRNRDEHGSLSPVHLTQLIVPPDLDDDAVIQKVSELNPDNAENAKNVVGKGIKEVVVLDFLAEAPANSTTSWYLRDPEMARNKFFWRNKIERSVARDESTGDYLYRVYFRCGVGADHYAGLFGSDGSGSETALGATVR